MMIWAKTAFSFPVFYAILGLAVRKTVCENALVTGVGMRINQAGLDLIKTFEGLELEAYVDPVGIWTIGFGHTGEVREGMVISPAQAEDLLRKDVSRTEKGVSSVINQNVNENEFSALVSLAYNIGNAALASSTALKRLNIGDRLGAAQAIEWWNKGRVNGRLVELPGLTRRRAAEKNLFLNEPNPQPKSQVDLPLMENTRLLPSTEASGRRESLGESRTIQGAGVSAVAGGTTAVAAAVEKNVDKADQLDPKMQRIFGLIEAIPEWAYWALGATAIVAALYVIFARVDDWRNYRR